MDGVWDSIRWDQLTADEKEQILSDFFEGMLEVEVWNEGTRRNVRLKSVPSK